MTAKTPQALPIPPAANSTQAREICRIWIADEDQHFVIQGGIWEDPAAWGLLLVDLAQQVASAYERDKLMTHAEALARLRAGFDAEWSVSAGGT